MAESTKPHEALVAAYALEWTNNECIFEALIDYNIGYLALSAEQNLLPREIANDLIECLVSIQNGGFSALPYTTERDGLQPNLEAEVIRRIGPEVGGWLSIGRARQECELVARQIIERNKLATLLDKVSAPLGALTALAQRDCRTYMPFYTWAQHAEPISFGYYALANAYAINADWTRLQSVFARLNQSRAGAGQVVPPPFEIDRKRLADLFGFSGPISNSLYAYSSMDIEIELLSALSNLGVNLSRLAETLFVWASPEFGFLRFAPEFTGTSYAMPQKKNPYALRLIRPVAARAAGALNEALQMHGGTLQIIGNGLIHISNRAIAVLEEFVIVCELLGKALPTISLDQKRMWESLEKGWVQAPQLVYVLTKRYGISFRQAHAVCGGVVRAKPEGIGSVTAEEIESVIFDITGKRIDVDIAELRRALEPEACVSTRLNGGPAPNSVQEDAEALKKLIDSQKAFANAVRDRIQNASRGMADLTSRFISPSELEI